MTHPSLLALFDSAESDLLHALSQRYVPLATSRADEQAAQSLLRQDLDAIVKAGFAGGDAFDLVAAGCSLAISRSVLDAVLALWRADAAASKSSRQSSAFRIMRLEAELSGAEQLFLVAVGEVRGQRSSEQKTLGSAAAACERCAADLREQISGALVELASSDGVFATDEAFRSLAKDPHFYVTRLVASLRSSVPERATQPAPQLLAAAGIA